MSEFSSHQTEPTRADVPGSIVQHINEVLIDRFGDFSNDEKQAWENRQGAFEAIERILGKYREAASIPDDAREDMRNEVGKAEIANGVIIQAIPEPRFLQSLAAAYHNDMEQAEVRLPHEDDDAINQGKQTIGRISKELAELSTLISDTKLREQLDSENIILKALRRRLDNSEYEVHAYVLNEDYIRIVTGVMNRLGAMYDIRMAINERFSLLKEEVKNPEQ